MLRASLIPPALAVQPGTAGSFALEVSGAGEMGVEVAGPAGEWAVVVPPTLSVADGATARARVVVQVPRSPQVAPGPATLTVRAVGPERGVAAEVSGTVEVLPFAEVRAALSPRVTRGRGGGRHVLHVENCGNRGVVAGLEPVGDEAVRVELDRASVELGPGEAVAVPVRVAAGRPRVAGRPRSLPFRVGVREGRAQPTAALAEGLHVQERLRWPLRAAAVAGAAAVVAGLALGGDDRRPRVAAAVPTTVAGAVPGQAATCPPTPADAPGPLVQNFLYCPATVTVAAGAEVRWTNLDQALHTVSADGNEFDTGNFGRGEVRGVRFDRPGTFPFFCRLHPFMRGTVVVTG